MVNFITALLLIIGGIKLAGPWTMFAQEHEILFEFPLQDENSKGQGCEAKEKSEQEQAVEEPGYMFPSPEHILVRYSIPSYSFFLSPHEEPISPPPDII